MATSSSQVIDYVATTTYVGHVDSTLDALRIIHAARKGAIPRVTRRLNEHERRTMIQSGAIFVFIRDESIIKRWTDGLVWSPSRIDGNFMVYRELNQRTGQKASAHITPISSHAMTTGCSFPAAEGIFKANGLLKKTIVVTIENSHHHLVAYYRKDDILSQKLKRPCSQPDIMSLPISPHMFVQNKFRVSLKTQFDAEGEEYFCPDHEADFWPQREESKLQEDITSTARPAPCPSTATLPEHAVTGFGSGGVMRASFHHRNTDRLSSGISEVGCPRIQEHSFTPLPISAQPSASTAVGAPMTDATWSSPTFRSYESSSNNVSNLLTPRSGNLAVGHTLSTPSAYTHSRTRMRPHCHLGGLPFDEYGHAGARHREGVHHAWPPFETHTDSGRQEACWSAYSPAVCNTYFFPNVAYASGYESACGSGP